MKIKYTRNTNPLAKLFAETPSIECEAEYKKLMIMENILHLMKEQGVSRSELASRMGIKPSRITAMMSGSNNFTIETLVRAGRALGSDLHQTFAPTGHKVRWSSYDSVKINRAFIKDIRPTSVKAPQLDFTLLATATDDDSKAA